MKRIDEVSTTTARVLNPVAHGSDSLRYEHEVKKALNLIAKLERFIA